MLYINDKKMFNFNVFINVIDNSFENISIAHKFKELKKYRQENKICSCFFIVAINFYLVKVKALYLIFEIDFFIHMNIQYFKNTIYNSKQLKFIELYKYFKEKLLNFL